jgi:soluble lytic murein transglycosylase-like protein
MGFSGNCPELFKPTTNIKYAGKYLDYLSGKYTALTDIIASYNSGKPIICKNYNPGKCEAGQYYNQAYVDSVFSRYVSIKLSSDQLTKVAIH